MAHAHTATHVHALVHARTYDTAIAHTQGGPASLHVDAVVVPAAQLEARQVLRPRPLREQTLHKVGPNRGPSSGL
jgi:hypothetical protein